MSAQPTVVTAKKDKHNRKSSLSGQEAAESSYFSANPSGGRMLKPKLAKRDINTSKDGQSSQESILNLIVKEPGKGKRRSMVAEQRNASTSSQKVGSQHSS